MATIFFYIGMMDLGAEHLIIIVGMGGGSTCQNFKCRGPRVCPKGGVLMAGIDSHINTTYKNINC